MGVCSEDSPEVVQHFEERGPGLSVFEEENYLLAVESDLVSYGLVSHYLYDFLQLARRPFPPWHRIDGGLLRSSEAVHSSLYSV